MYMGCRNRARVGANLSHLVFQEHHRLQNALLGFSWDSSQENINAWYIYLRLVDMFMVNLRKYKIYRAPITSIFEGQPPKTSPLPTKTRSFGFQVDVYNSFQT